MAVAKITEKPESASLASSAHVLITQDVSGTETLQRAPLSQFKEKVTADLKSATCTLSSAVMLEKNPSTVAENYRLNESDGFITSNNNYKVIKYAVHAGDVVKVVSDDRFQFQSSIILNFSGTSTLVGSVYGSGTYILTVPDDATYLMVSTLNVGSTAAVYTNSAVLCQGITVLAPTKAYGDRRSYHMSAGEWYRITNRSSTYFTISFSKNGVTGKTFASGLLSGNSVCVQADDNYDGLLFYTGTADQTAEVDVAKYNPAFESDESQQEITPFAEVAGYRLASEGYCTSDADYKLIKYNVTPGDLLKVFSDNSFQFQTSATVNNSGTNFLVGFVYRKGIFETVVPEGAHYLIVSTPITDGLAACYIYVDQIKAMQDDVSDVSGKVDDFSDAFSSAIMLEKYQSALTSGHRLNESNGYVTSNSAYNVIKYAVKAGEVVKVVSDDRFQFHNSVVLNYSGTSGLVGETYGAGTYLLTVPDTATYLMVSTPASGSIAKCYTNAVERRDVTTVLAPTSSYRNDRTYSLKSGNWYRITNLSSTYFTISLKKTGQSSKTVASLFAGDSMCILADDNYDAITFYTESGSSTAEVSVEQYEASIGTDDNPQKSVTPFATSDNYRLATSVARAGYCESDSNYKIVKYYVCPGDRLKVVSDDAFQLQNNPTVNLDSNNYLVGAVYRRGTFEIDVPDGVHYLIVSTPKTDSEAYVYFGTKVKYFPMEYTWQNPFYLRGTSDPDCVTTYNSTTSLNDIYKFYQILVSSFDDVVRTKIGDSQTPTGEYAEIDSRTYPMYVYSIRGMETKTDTENRIILSSGIHGDGWMNTDTVQGDAIDGLCGLAYFIKKLLYDWASDPFLEWMRKHCNIFVCPVLNPWGIQNHRRTNGRGVDLNRNFDCEWVAEEYDYGGNTGAYAASESETQAWVSFLTNTIGEGGAKFSLEIHSRGGIMLPTGAARWLMYYPPDRELFPVMHTAGAVLIKQFGGPDSVNASTRGEGQQFRYSNDVIKIPSVLAEGFCGFDTLFDQTIHSWDSMMQNCAFWGTLIKYLVRHYVAI